MSIPSLVGVQLALVVLIGYEIPASLAQSPVLKVTPPNQASEAGHDVTFKCEYYPEDKEKTKHLDWLLPDGVSVYNITKDPSISNDSFHERFSFESGKLTIRNVSEADDGSYICRNSDGSMSHTSILRIYVMPSYFTEGMIVVGINGGLILLFFTCFLLTSYKLRKMRRMQGRSRITKVIDSPK